MILVYIYITYVYKIVVQDFTLYLLSSKADYLAISQQKIFYQTEIFTHRQVWLNWKQVSSAGVRAPQAWALTGPPTRVKLKENVVLSTKRFFYVFKGGVSTFNFGCLISKWNITYFYFIVKEKIIFQPMTHPHYI